MSSLKSNIDLQSDWYDIFKIAITVFPVDLLVG